MGLKIKRIPSPNFSSRQGVEVDLIVIHSISLPTGEFGTGYVVDLFLNRLDPKAHPSFEELQGMRVSSHYFIDRQGEIIEFVPPEYAAWHAGESSFEGRTNCNLFSIGIELEGDISISFTDQQYESLIELCHLLMERYPSIRPERIVGHSDIAPHRKKDPGPLFSWERLREGLAKRKGKGWREFTSQKRG